MTAYKSELSYQLNFDENRNYYFLLTLNNVTFIDNYASQRGGAVGINGRAILNCNNSDFNFSAIAS